MFRHCRPCRWPGANSALPVARERGEGAQQSGIVSISAGQSLPIVSLRLLSAPRFPITRLGRECGSGAGEVGVLSLVRRLRGSAAFENDSRRGEGGRTSAWGSRGSLKWAVQGRAIYG